MIFRMLKYVLNVVMLLLMVNIVKAQTPATTKLKDTSVFTITNEYNHNYTKISIYAKDKQDGLPMLAMVGFRDKSNKIIANFFTDKAGFALVNLFDFSHIAFITVDYIGYDAISVPISRLKGKSSVITVSLKGQDITHEGIN